MDSRGAIASRSVDLSRTLLGPLREATRALRARLDPLAFPDVALLNRFVGVPTPHARYRFARGLDAPVYFLDFNYRDRARAAACLDELARVRRAHGLRFADKTLLLSARGLDPHGAALLDLAHEFAHHHVFFELWNNTVEIDDLHRARLQALYFVPVTAALDLGPAAAMPARPNRRVFVSLGTDDDLELVRAVIRARPDVHFCVPSVSWQKPSEGRRDFEVRIQAPNVTRVRCRPSRFSLHYLRAYASCDTVLVATSAAKVQQMRGGIRIADAIAAGKRLVATRSPMCELLMAQHERTCLVTGHDAGGVSTALDRMLDGSFQVDAPLFEAIRALTRDRDKLSWMMATRTDPARARRSPFWRDEADLDGHPRPERRAEHPARSALRAHPRSAPGGPRPRCAAGGRPAPAGRDRLSPHPLVRRRPPARPVPVDRAHRALLSSHLAGALPVVPRQRRDRRGGAGPRRGPPAPLMPLPRDHADALVTRALTAVAKGNLAGGLAAWREALEAGPSPELAAIARPTLLRVEGRRVASGGSPSPARSPEEPPSAAWAAAWAGDLAAARRLAEGAGDASALGVLGAVLVLERRSEAGVALLDRALALGGGQDLILHRTRALVHLGRLAEAGQALAALVDGESLARRVLIALVHARGGGHGPLGFERWCRQVASSETHLNGLFANELPALVGRAALERAFTAPEALAALLDGLLDRMAGNLGLSPTFAEVAPDGRRRFVRVAVPLTTRARAVEALNSLREGGAAAAEAALTSLRAEHPRSVHALCYRGELYLWLGRYGDAWRDFLASRWIEAARWADVGMLAVLLLTGRTRRARLMALYAERHFSFIPGGTLPVYRGALRRRTGEIDGAIANLAAAVAVKPTRVGARIELCLALRAAGRRAEATEQAAEVMQRAAPLLVDAAEARGLAWRREPAVLVGDAVLTEALGAMRGNRSSAMVTWIDSAGALRVLSPRDALQDEARRALGKAPR